MGPPPPGTPPILASLSIARLASTPVLSGRRLWQAPQRCTTAAPATTLPILRLLVFKMGPPPPGIPILAARFTARLGATPLPPGQRPSLALLTASRAKLATMPQIPKSLAFKTDPPLSGIPIRALRFIARLAATPLPPGLRPSLAPPAHTLANPVTTPQVPQLLALNIKGPPPGAPTLASLFTARLETTRLRLGRKPSPALRVHSFANPTITLRTPRLLASKMEPMPLGAPIPVCQ